MTTKSKETTVTNQNTDTSSVAKESKKRPVRVPFHQSRDILTAHNAPEGFVLRWVNDTDDRVERCTSAGYEFLTDRGIVVGDRTVDSLNGKEVGAIITKKVGGSVTAYLMAQREDWYEADQKAKQRTITENETNSWRNMNEGKGAGMYGSVTAENPTR